MALKLFYDPFDVDHLSKVHLYTEENIATFSEAEREGLQELDAEAIQNIGQRPCVFEPVTTHEERKKDAERLYLHSKEKLGKLEQQQPSFLDWEKLHWKTEPDKL
jgi:hypothetical protein